MIARFGARKKPSRAPCPPLPPPSRPPPLPPPTAGGSGGRSMGAGSVLLGPDTPWGAVRLPPPCQHCGTTVRSQGSPTGAAPAAAPAAASAGGALAPRAMPLQVDQMPRCCFYHTPWPCMLASRSDHLTPNVPLTSPPHPPARCHPSAQGACYREVRPHCAAAAQGRRRLAAAGVHWRV